MAHVGRTRHVGSPKVYPQHMLTVAAINRVCLGAGHASESLAQTRPTAQVT